MFEGKKRNVSVLVIDDDRSRDTSYSTLFELYNRSPKAAHVLNYDVAKTPEEAVDQLLRSNCQLVVLDMLFVASNWAISLPKLRDTLRKQSVPIILLSADLQQAESKLNETVGALKDTNQFVGFWSFDERIRARTLDLNGKLREDCLDADVVLDLNYHLSIIPERCLLMPSSGIEEFTFLHFTDTHFGNNDFHYGNATSIAKSILQLGKPDHIIWTGDVSDCGLPSHFDQAEKFINTLTNHEGFDSSIELSIVPGNHDFNWPLALSSRGFK
jgi:hypothetical protein